MPRVLTFCSVFSPNPFFGETMTTRTPSEFRTIGAFGAAVRHATINPHSAQARTMSTTLGSDGGFLVPTGITESLTDTIFARSYLLSRCTRRNTTQSTYDGVIPDESITDTNGGRFGGMGLPPVAQDGLIAFEWPKSRGVTLEMHKGAGIAPATNEMVEDGNVEEYLDEVAPRVLTQMMERQVFSGSGVGEALGIVRSPSLIAQSIEPTQTIANTPQFLAANAARMVAQVLDLESAAFYVHPELLTAALLATVNSNEKAILTPPDAEAPFGRLATRPVFPNYHAPAVGTVGDFVLASMPNYLVVTKGTLRKAVSVHARFLQDEALFRFSIRWNGAPMLGSTVIPSWSSTPKSHYVALAARS